LRVSNTRLSSRQIRPLGSRIPTQQYLPTENGKTRLHEVVYIASATVLGTDETDTLECCDDVPTVRDVNGGEPKGIHKTK
jgi:hypothetical protein